MPGGKTPLPTVFCGCGPCAVPIRLKSQVPGQRSQVEPNLGTRVLDFLGLWSLDFGLWSFVGYIGAVREADLFPPLRSYFQQLGYSVYAEVPAPHGGYVDLLAVKEQTSVGVELKLRFSREAARQAARNKRFLWQSWVAVPEHSVLPPRRLGTLKRHRLGLLLAGASGVRVALDSPVAAPPCTVREAFGRLLEGELGTLFAAAEGGVPTAERLSIFRVLVERVQAAVEKRGGLANTDDLLADTLPWNYFRGKRSGLRWILENRFAKVDADLWALKRAARRHAPARHQIPAELLVRTHLPNTFVCLGACDRIPRPGDFADLVRDGRAEGRARVISSAVHPVVETPQRELRAGPAVFFPWRCPIGVPLPPRALVLRLSPVERRATPST